MGNPIGILIAGEAPSSLLFKHCLLTPGVLPNTWNGKYSPIGNTITGWHLNLNNSRRSSTLVSSKYLLVMMPSPGFDPDPELDPDSELAFDSAKPFFSCRMTKRKYKKYFMIPQFGRSSLYA